ncbi:MAG: PQQ-binding-like beta-propeller repeat protein [Methanoregula sp.]
MCLLVVMPAGAMDWGMTGMDSGHTSFSPDTVMPPLAVSWTTDNSFLNTYPAPAVIVSDSIVYTREGVINGSGFESWISARNTGNGSLIWRFSGASPAVAYQDHLFAWNNESVICLKNGREVWRQPVTSVNSPILYNDLLIAGEVTAFHYQNGSVIWNYHPQLPLQDARYIRIDSYLPITAGNNTVILAINSMESEQFDNRSGSDPSTPGDSQTVWSYRSSPDELSGTLIALDAASGKERWIQKIPILIKSAPVIFGDRVFIGGNGSVQAYHLANGSVVWKTVLPGYQRTLAADSEFLIVDEWLGQNLTALRLDDGKTGWIYQSTGRSRSMSVSGQIMYIVGTKPSSGLVAVDAKTGKQIWEQEMPADWISPSQPVISDNMIYVTTMTGKTIAFSHRDTPQDQNSRPNPLPSAGIVLSIGAMICIPAVTRRRS